MSWEIAFIETVFISIFRGPFSSTNFTRCTHQRNLMILRPLHSLESPVPRWPLHHSSPGWLVAAELLSHTHPHDKPY
jgi:hypothetical protein